MIPIITSIDAVAARSRAWLVDIWGVMHDGVTAFPGAVAACNAFRARGGFVVLVSNAPRPAPAVRAQLDRIGVPHTAYDAIVSSGDVARVLIARQLGMPLFHVGPERDRPLFEGLDVKLAPLVDARMIVCTGLFDDESESPSDYTAWLSAAAERALPMICANPDLAVERAGRLVPCAGAVAAHYVQLGGAVTYTGKPHLPIYDRVFEVIAELAQRSIPRRELLAIGDGVSTDIAGAATVGVPSVYVASNVNLAGAHLDVQSLNRLFRSVPVPPVAAMAFFA